MPAAPQCAAPTQTSKFVPHCALTPCVPLAALAQLWANMSGVLCDAALGVGGAPSRLLQAAAAGWGAGGRLSLRAALWGALVRTPTGLAMGLGECMGCCAVHGRGALVGVRVGRR